MGISFVLAGCGGGRDDDSNDDNHTPPVSPAGPGASGDAADPAARLAVDLYGDSILAGYGVLDTPARRLVQAHPQWSVFDHSAYGVKLSDLVPNLPYVPRAGPYTVLALGINDAIAQDDQFEANLRYAIELLLREARTPVLTGLVNVPDPSPRMVQFNAITLELARQYGLEHARWHEDYRAGDAAEDGLHRTQAASDRLAALLLQALERAARAKNPAR